MWDPSHIMSQKFLIVIDDVDHWDQVQTLIKSCVRFAPGSRIVITTRDKRLLEMCQMDGSFEIEVLLYEADALSNEEAIKLFSQYDFKQDVPEIDHVNLSDRMVKYA